MKTPTHVMPNENPMMLKLKRPIVFLDIQTTGRDVRTARIVRLSTLRIAADGTEELRSHLINPLMPISPGASQFHGIHDYDVHDAKPFVAFAKALNNYLSECDLAGFRIRRFHLKVLRREFELADIDFSLENRAVVDAMQIFHALEPRDFAAAHRRFVGNDFQQHSQPEAVVNAVRAVLGGQLQQNPELPTDPSALERWATGARDEGSTLDDGGKFVLSDDGVPIINFGRYRGHTLYEMSETDPGYLRWMAGNDSFTDEQRSIAADVAKGVIPDGY